MSETRHINEEANWSVFKKLWRKLALKCSYCPPNAGENQGRNNGWDQKGWKAKTRRRRQYRVK